MENSAMGKISAFCSYAHEDAHHLAELKAVLAPLREKAVIDDWSDGRIEPGQNWNTEIRNALESAHLVLFIITPDLLKSRFILEEEIPLSLERRLRGECEVVPIQAVNPLDDKLWHANPLAKLQPLPDVGVWLNEYPEKNIAYDEIRFGIGEVCKRVGGGDNPYRRSKLGDWRHCQMRMELAGENAQWEFTEELVEKTESKAVLRIQSTQSGELKEKLFEIDLTTALNTQTQNVANQAGIDLSGAAAMATSTDADGMVISEELVSIGFASYQTRVSQVKSESELNGLKMETSIKVWKSIDVPFDGVVRQVSEYTWSNGAKGLQSMSQLAFGFGDAASKKPAPKSFGQLSPMIGQMFGQMQNQNQAGQTQGGPGLPPIENTGSEIRQGFQQMASAIVPGRWQIQCDPQYGNVMFDVFLNPNFQLQGYNWFNGVQWQVSGSWSFDMNFSTLRIDYNSVAFGQPPSQNWATFQITQSDQRGFSATDMNGWPFRIWRVG